MMMVNLISEYSYILILAIGMVLVIIAGHIDLSVGSVAAFAGIVVALAMRDWGLPWYLGILVGLPAFIVTLAGMMLFRGANQFVGSSTTVPVPVDFQFIGAGYLPEIGPNTGYNNLTVLLGLIVVAAVIYGQIRS